MAVYDTSDPRSALAPATQDRAQASRFSDAECAKLYETEPAEETGAAETWYVRGQHLVVAFSECRDGAVFRRDAQPDEFVVLLPDRAAGATIEVGGDAVEVDGFSLAIVPPGESRMRMNGAGRMVRLFTARSEDLAEMCSNAGSYAQPKPNVAPFEPWPEPSSGLRVRRYSLDVPPEEGRFGRIFRCSTIMVNYLEPFMGPRDVTKLSPHHHDDFEQCSLGLEGEFIHHLRWPWIPDMTQWREDEHLHCGSPSVTIIPPPAVHTTQAIGAGANLLADVFCPPRLDFSQQPGWVLNGEDYPLP